jgi:hypothetical protein
MDYLKRLLNYFILYFLLGICIFSYTNGTSQIYIPDIGTGLEIFLDDFLVDKLDNLKLVLHHPIDEGPVLYFDKSWEGSFCGYATVIKDQNCYRLFYRGLPEAGQNGTQKEVTCYAESEDGKHWKKPQLDLFEINGSKGNNVILADTPPFSHNFSPFLDTNPKINPEFRYKALAGNEKSGLVAFVSSNGLHWTRYQPEPVIREGKFDSQNVAFWSETEDCYVCYFRTWTGEGYKGYRSVSRTTSKDFICWTPPIEMDFGNTPREHIYTNQTHPYFRAPHIYLAIAARFFPGKQVLSNQEAETLKVNPEYFKDCSDAILMTSRGGNKYFRLFMEGFIRPGIGLENWVSRSNYPAQNVVQTGPSEMSIYVNQNYAQPTAHLRRYTLRIDGFSSIQASYTTGTMQTKPFLFQGKNLFINFSTSAAGEILTEIQDKNAQPIPGYSMEDSIPIIGNEISKMVGWKNGNDLTIFQGKPVRLLFRMKDADLYAIQFR